MAIRRYRLTSNTIALFRYQDKYVARSVLDNALLEFDSVELLSRKLLIEVVLEEDQTVLMFVTDLKTIAVPER